MPKALREPPPSSSVARLFDLGAASRAVAAMPPLVEDSQESKPMRAEYRSALEQSDDVSRPRIQSTALTGEPANIKRELVLSPSTDQTFTNLVDLYRRSTGTRLSASHVARAMLTAAAHAVPSLEHEARQIGRLKLPSNARGREGERERFERRLAQAFVAGMRAAAALNSD